MDVGEMVMGGPRKVGVTGDGVVTEVSRAVSGASGGKEDRETMAAISRLALTREAYGKEDAGKGLERVG